MESNINSLWPNHDKLIFALTSSGKPIFSNAPDDGHITTLMGLIQALISFSVTDTRNLEFDNNNNIIKKKKNDIGSSDIIRSININNNTIIVFLIRGPIYLVNVSRIGERESILQLELEFLYHQILFILTSKVTKKLQKNPRFDLKDLLGGTDNIMNNLIDRKKSCYYFLNSVRILSLPLSIRSNITNMIISKLKLPDVFSILLLCGSRIITMIQPKSKNLHISTTDLLLLINFVVSQPSLKENESWTPLCLSRFNNTGFLYSYISYLDSSIDLSIIIISTNNSPDSFHIFQNAKTTIYESLQNTESLSIIERSYRSIDTLINQNLIPLDPFLYFIYKSSSNRSSKFHINKTSDIELYKLENEIKTKNNNEFNNNNILINNEINKIYKNKNKKKDDIKKNNLKKKINNKLNENIRNSPLQNLSNWTPAVSSISGHGLSQIFESNFAYPYDSNEDEQILIIKKIQDLFLILRTGNTTITQLNTSYFDMKEEEEFEKQKASGNPDEYKKNNIDSHSPFHLFELDPHHILVYYLYNSELYIGINGVDYEIYTLLPSTILPNDGISLTRRLIRLIKQHEEELFLMNIPTWT